MKENFDKVLLGDERVICAFKPRKTAFIMRMTFPFLVVALVYLAMFATVIGVTISEGIGPLPVLFVLIGLIVVLAAVYIPLAFNRYRNTFYAVTNKRLIIRTGFIGVDYLSLDISAATAVSVNVSLINKMFGGGSLAFGAASRPIGVGERARAFSFTDIDDPYENYKTIKEMIDGKAKESENATDTTKA